MILQNFIVFEGIDGAGTSTQMHILQEQFSPQEFFFTHEPTSSEVGKFLRSILSGKILLNPATIAHLFVADRYEHVYGKNGIIDQLHQNKIVFCDRYIFSSLAYQGQTCGEKLPFLLNKNFPLPQFLFFFDIDPEISLRRIQNRAVTEIYEKKDFLKKTALAYRSIIAKYKKIAEQEGMSIIVIDATLPIAVITEKILTCVKELPIL